jgi:hypothetical protein
MKTTDASGRLSHVLLSLLSFTLWSCLPVRAEISEPDNVLYGTITNVGRLVTSAQTNMIVEARKAAAGSVIASYRLGEQPALENFYALRIPLEALLPLTDPSASRIGALVYLTLRDESGVRDQRTIAIADRGKFVRFDWADPDSDGDGMSDRWESRYFGNGTGGDPFADPDGDGRNNLTESLENTNPFQPDGHHPADHAPTDNRITAVEVEAYAAAWLDGASWPVGPTNIPISHVTRAGRLWLGGETYVFTNSPPTNTPMWWVNSPLTPAPSGTNRIVADALPSNISPGQLIQIGISVTPHEHILNHAIEDQPPAGWDVGAISHGGVYDPINRKVKWGPFFDNGERQLIYEVTVTGASGQGTFQGTGSFDGLNFSIAGSRIVNAGNGGGPLSWTLSTRDAQGFLFRLSGLPSTSYAIEMSTNLVTWQLVANIATGTNGTFDFRPANTSSRGYYRALPRR